MSATGIFSAPLPFPDDPNDAPFHRIILDPGRPLLWPTEDRGLLAVSAGPVHLSFSLSAVSEGEEPESRDILHCRLRLSDASGRPWQADTWCLPSFIMDQLSAGNASRLVFTDELPKDWNEELESAMLVSGVRDFLDDRFLRTLVIENQIFEVPFKFQTPVYDIALPSAGSPASAIRLVVRISGLMDADMEEIPPFVVEIPPEQLLFSNTAYPDPCEAFWSRNCLSVPPVFRPLSRKDGTDPPNTGVSAV